MAEQRCPGCMQTKLQHPVCEHCGYDARTPNLPHQLPAGTVLQNRYLVGKVLGQGGFGITYMGWDQYLDAPVAIKEYYPNGIVIRDSSLSLSVTAIEGEYSKFYAENRQRFFREAKALARFAEVPNIVHIQNLFLDNNTAYIVMEYLHGVTLKHYVSKKDGKLSPKETFAILLPIMKALETVHEAGIVHRDLSPDNIMLLPGGKAKLLDFGAVREVHDAEVDKPLTQSTEAILKHGFAPIEQYQRRGGLGPWTDVYALCATIYYCLTGTVPEDAPLRVMGEAEVDWSSVPGLTAQQQRALAAGMAIAPKQRTRSVKELRRELFQADAPTLPKGSQSAYPSGTVPLAKGKAYTAPLSDPGQTVPNAPYTAPLRTSAQITTATTPAPQTAQAQPKRTLPKWLLPGALAALAAVLGIALLSPKEEPNNQLAAPSLGTTEAKLTDEPAEPIPSVVETDATEEPTEWILPETTLMESLYKRSDAALRGNLFIPGIRRSAVCNITFYNTLKDAPHDAVDVSYHQNGKVLAWTKHNENYKEEYFCDVYIAAEGGVYAPPDSSYLFAGIGVINKIPDTINFNDSFYTDYVTNMDFMFYGCPYEKLDLSGFSTKNVKTMVGMFMGEWFDLTNEYYSPYEIDLSSFDTSNVTSMFRMFDSCGNLQNLDISHFNTSNVTNMYGMFLNCKALPQLNLSGFDTSRVENMSHMFWQCPKLTNVEGNFDVSSVTNYEAFMDEDDTFNGRPWEELFR